MSTNPQPEQQMRCDECDPSFACWNKVSVCCKRARSVTSIPSTEQPVTEADKARQLVCEIIRFGQANRIATLQDIDSWLNLLLSYRRECVEAATRELHEKLTQVDLILRRQGHDIVDAAKDAMTDIAELEAKLSAAQADVRRMDEVRLAALKQVALHVNAIPESHIENNRLEHAFVLAAHRILATSQPVGY